jgi:hypothetical protein
VNTNDSRSNLMPGVNITGGEPSNGESSSLGYKRHLASKDLLTFTVGPLFTYLLTHFMVQDVIRKAECHSACQTISRLLMEPDGSLPCSQKSAIGPYPEPSESSLPHRSQSP